MAITKIMNTLIRNPLLLMLFFLVIATQSKSHAMDKHFFSSAHKVTLLELYTSEGCSSCPPAEKWMASLKANSQLWKQFVPVAFHVDYWDYIGWKDPFARNDYGLRQREYRQLGNIRTVYTPGMMLNGREWQKWHYRRSVPTTGEIVGNLDVVLKGNKISAVFSPVDKKITEWELNVAVLGFNLKSDVHSGENAGRRLKQEFVVLGYLREGSNDGQWQVNLPRIKKEYANHTGLAVWVNMKGEQTPVQATGGWLKALDDR
ncbi:MAG: DUF1223 domain-containing protein [Pseudomonadota bacterium]|nr:DUF1223 domain-containing protein [Pseudomonadota bacterium]